MPDDAVAYLAVALWAFGYWGTLALAIWRQERRRK